MGVTKKEIISLVTSGRKYQDICRRLTPGLFKDLYQDLLLELLESKEIRFQKINCPDCFLYRMLTNMVNSKTSRFYYKYKRTVNVLELESIESESYNHDIDINVIAAHKIINYLPNHDKKIINSWIDGKSDRKIASENNVPRYFITKKIKSITTKLQQEIKIQELNNQIRILLIIQKSTTALQYHRQYIPHQRLQKTNSSEFKIEFTHGDGLDAGVDSMTDEQLKEYQIVYYLRQISFNPDKIIPTIERLHRLGIKVVMDIDDYWVLPEDHYWHNMYEERKVAKHTTDTLKEVDWVITTTHYFANKIKEYNKNVTVIPNCISPDDSQFDQIEIESERMRFGWIGGVYHGPDIKIISESINRMYNTPYGRDFRDDIQLSVGGFSCNEEYKEIEKVFTANYSFKNSDATYYNYLMQCTPAMEHIGYNKQYRRQWGLDIHNYGGLYNGVDVVLAPLKDNEFNRCKSELKIVEAGWMKKAAICSRISPYQQWIRHEVNGILINPSRNNIDWFTAIRRLVLNPNMAEDMGEALHETITKNFDLDTHNKTRAELYKSLI